MQKCSKRLSNSTLQSLTTNEKITVYIIYNAGPRVFVRYSCPICSHQKVKKKFILNFDLMQLFELTRENYMT